MEKVVTFCIGTLSCFSLAAQAPFNSDQFSVQLKEIVNDAKNNFINIPEDYVLEGAISHSIKKTGNGNSSYHALFARNISVVSTKKMEKFLAGQIILALNDCSIQLTDGNLQSTTFRSKCDCNIILVKLITIHKNGGQNDIYIDVPYTRTDNTSIPKNPDIIQRTKKIIIDKLGVDENELTADACFTNDLGADSLDLIELVLEFEKKFNISIPDEEAECIRTVGQAISYLENHIK